MKYILSSVILLGAFNSFGSVCKETSQGMIQKSYNCQVSSIEQFQSDISSVKIDLIDGAIAVHYKYRNFDQVFSEYSDNSDRACFHEFRKNQIIFGFDGDSFGKLASFDEGRTFEGQAVIAEDFTVFLTCTLTK